MRKIALSKKNKTLSLKAKVIIAIIIFVLAVSSAAVIIFFNTYHKYETKIIKPTCETEGYTELTCVYCKNIIRKNYTAALGHKFGNKKIKSKPTEIEFGEETQTCSICKKENIFYTPPTSKIKKFNFTGSIFDVGSNKLATGKMSYSNGKKSSKEYYVKLQYTDNDNREFIKHDYYVKFYDDAEYSKEAELSLIKNVAASYRWNLYGNYYDYYNLRDTVTKELFCEARKSSATAEPKSKDNYLTARSEPVLFYVNQELVGVFRLSEFENADTMNLDDEPEEQCAIVSANASGLESFFKKETNADGLWRIKYNSSDDNRWVYNSLNSLINTVKNEKGENFKEEIKKHLDVDAMIDYMLTVYNTAAADNVARGMTMATYDGKIWIPVISDANASLGLNNKGIISDLDTVLTPIKDAKDIDSDTDSLLWDKMLKYYYDEIKSRYNTLKQTVFTADNIYSKFQNHIEEVPEIVYNEEKLLYPEVDSETDLKTSITEFIASRKNILDDFFK